MGKTKKIAKVEKGYRRKDNRVKLNFLTEKLISGLISSTGILSNS